MFGGFIFLSYLCIVKIKTSKTMTRQERKEYIIRLDKVVKRWRRNSNLFAGGCCFSAGQIAKMLEKKHIRYNVICWKCGQSDAKRLKDIILKNECGHVGIVVSLDGNYFLIGGGFWHFSVTNILKYNINSKRLIECDLLGADLNLWNWEYNRNLNKKFTNVLNKAVK